MARQFDADYWEQRHRGSAQGDSAPSGPGEPNPHLIREISPLRPGRALDAGCGHGWETAWLAEHGWQVTGVDISRTALDRADRILRARGVSRQVELVAADLTSWRPNRTFDLVTTHYAHPTIPQLDFYRRISQWVSPGGTLLIVGHQHHRGHDHSGQQEHQPGHQHGRRHRTGGAEHQPEEAQVQAADVVALLDERTWRIETAEETRRHLHHAGQDLTLDDVVVRATRLT